MASTWIVKLPRSEGDNEPVLLQVTQKKSHVLDLDLLATEGEAVYRGKVRYKTLKDFRSNRNVTEDDFAAILHYAFISKSGSNISDTQRKSLEVVASVGGKKEKALTVTFRNRIDGITQRFGTVDLPETDDEISLFDWAITAVNKQDALESELASIKIRSEYEQATITSLQAEIADLVRAKAEHEDQLLSKFALLLNEKKVKIRNQQRMLSTAKVDEKKLQEMGMTLKGVHTTSRTSHGIKRGAEDAAGQEDNSDSSDDFETAAGRPSVGVSRRRGSSKETTPETETASEDEAMGTSIPPVASTRAKPASPLPEPRSLPFARKPEKQKVQEQTEVDVSVVSPGSDEETASEDDEL